MKRPGFTFTGFAVIVFSLGILIHSLYIRNAYEILVSSVITVLWILLFAFGSWYAGKLALEPGWKTPHPFTALPVRDRALPSGANTLEKTVVSGLDCKVPWFFRLYLVVEGRFFPAGSASSCHAVIETAVPRGSRSAELDLSFPMSGVFQGECGSCLKDIFGVFSFRCGIKNERTLNILSAPVEKKVFYVDPLSGAEDRKTKTASDEERYYMREYTPGDRLRDINWKSSDRIDTLITRISPDTNEKVCRIEIYFRNYGPASPSLEELWLLDRAKANLSRFLRSLKEKEDAFVFVVHTANFTRELKDSQSIEDFLEELAGVPFSQGTQMYPFENENPGEIYVFSTACDQTLPAFLLACHELVSCKTRRVSLFMIEPAPSIKGKGRTRGDSARQKTEKLETLFVRDFVSSGCVPSRKWFGKRKPKALKSLAESAGAGSLEISYAETRL
jgi:hypothetical protein